MNIEGDKLTWVWLNFEDLTVANLYWLLKLRQDIFIVEQDVPYTDIDNIDIESKHLLGFSEDMLVASLRLLPKDLFEKDYISFGRVVVRKEYRGKGLGHQLVKRLFHYLDQHKINHNIKISSQLYLKGFYSKYNFKVVGKPYIEDRIKHIAMIHKKS